MNENWRKKFTDFWLKYEVRVVLLLGFILIALISFEGGYLKGKSAQNSPLIVEKASAEAQNCIPASTELNSAQVVQNSQNSKKECPFIASKNSNKYHVASCTWAKRIKPENLVCYKTAQEAEAAGKQKCSCIK